MFNIFKKKIKVQIPIRNKCSKCKQLAKLDEINEYYITHDNVCVATYKCKCGNEDIIRQNVKFV
jgi:ribosome maturation protein Sdo1